MLIRIVKMEFQEALISDFKALFEEVSPKIRNFEGCKHLDLWQDQNNPCVIFTHSHWQSPKDLENYRQSDFFADTWSKTKQLFGGKPHAWSVEKIA